MKTLHLKLTILLLLLSSTIALTQPNDTIVNCTSKIDSLLSDNSVLIKSIENQNETINVLRSKVENLTNDAVTNKNSLKESRDSISILMANYAELKSENDKLTKSKLKSEIDELKVSIDQLQEKIETLRKENERLSMVETQYESLKEVKQQLSNDLELLKEDKSRIEKELSDLREKNENLELALKTFKGFQDDAIKMVNEEIPALVEGDDFYQVNDKIDYFQSKIDIIKSVGNSNNNLTTLEAQLNEFKKTVNVFELADSLLNKQYNKAEIEVAIQKLESLENKQNKYFNVEKIRLLKLLKNYCNAYTESAAFSNGLVDDKDIVIEYIGYFKVFTIEDITVTNKKVFINVYENYPFIKNIIDKREKDPNNQDYSIPTVNSTCN